jgi:SAM-dependent methyltransferase
VSAGRIVGLYEENAAAWDRQRGRDFFERPWMERFAALLPEGGRVLDIGCGMGEPIGRYFVDRGFAVTGVDSSPSLIALCRERFPAHSWIVGDMRSLDLGEAFDGLLAWHSFFHLAPDDQRAMFGRFAAHSAPGAALMFTSGPEEGVSIGEWQGEPLYHSSLSPEEYPRLLSSHGFELVDHVASDPECGSATIWLARFTGPGCRTGAAARRLGAAG